MKDRDQNEQTIRGLKGTHNLEIHCEYRMYNHWRTWQMLVNLTETQRINVGSKRWLKRKAWRPNHKGICISH